MKRIAWISLFNSPIRGDTSSGRGEEGFSRQETRIMIQVNRSQETIADRLDATQELVKTALARVRQGFAPPADIYRVEYRQQIDWSQFPLWARSIDPEIYTGCCHEG
jgi:hypothetical protein